MEKGNRKTGTYLSIVHKYLPRYLAEFCCRFNRRFDLRQMMPRFGCSCEKLTYASEALVLAEDYGSAQLKTMFALANLYKCRHKLES